MRDKLTDRSAGIDAAERYLDPIILPADPEPPTPWLAMLTIIAIIALIAVAVLRGMEWWHATTLGVVMSAGATMAWGGLIAEAGRDAGVVR